MTVYRSDRELLEIPHDWDAEIAALELKVPFGHQYRFVPIDIPFTAAEMDALRQGQNSPDMSGKWDFEFRDNKLLILHSWNESCLYILRFGQDREGYRLLDMIENCDPDQWNIGETSCAEASGWVLNTLGSMLEDHYFQWQSDVSCDGWLWHSPPRRPRSSLVRLAERLPGLRSRFQQAFAKWLNDDQLYLRVPIQLRTRTRNAWSFSFEGIAPEISASLINHRHHHELTVVVEWQGEQWGILNKLMVKPRLDHFGYTCAMREEHEYYFNSSREALWERLLFAPLRIWINEQLAEADWLVLEEVGATKAAWLACERPNDRSGQFVVPLKVGASTSA